MPTLVYDGDCDFCRKRALWLSKHDRNDLVIVAWQKADLESMSLTAQECSLRVQWVDGNHHAAGGAAIAKCLTSCSQPWRTAGIVMQWPVIRRLTELGYRAVAANRRFL
jgi:predicted DCC family thiol-disulfide oxidoreductase YuxK